MERSACCIEKVDLDDMMDPVRFMEKDKSLLSPIEDKLFRMMVEDAAVGVGVFEGENLIYANTNLMAMFSYSRRQGEEEFENFVCHHASPATKSMMQVRDAMMREGTETVTPFVGEFAFDNHKKNFIEIHSRGFRTSDRFLRICFMIDVTEKLETRIELDQRVHRFKNIIAGTDAATWEWNLIDHVGIYNEKWEETIGYRPGELETLGEKGWTDLIHPDDRQMIDRLITDLVSGRTETLKFEGRLRHKNGHWVWVLSRGRVSDWTSDGKPRTLSGANIDINEKKLAEAKLLLAKEEIERSLNALSRVSHAKEEFLSTMSHEIRTPLNAVIGLTNLLLRRDPRPDQLEIVKTLKNAGDNLLHLVNDILDYSKIEAGKLQIETIRFNFKEFLEHLYSIFKHDAHDKNIDLEVKADPQIPDVLKGDVTRLNQILTNLLGNALKFTKKGKVSLDASLVSLDDGVCIIRFVVTDTGIGIPTSNLEKIFEPFHQSDASISRQFGGTGLGLSIIRGLVKMFQGDIDVSSVPGRGTSFSVTLRLEEPTAFDEAWKGRLELPFKAKSLNILYVEDVPSNRFLVANLMDEFNFKCVVAANGIEALERTMTERFDVILMDIQMPGMDGYEVAEKIYNQRDGKNNRTPIVAFTAEPVTEILKTKLEQYHMRDVISKPFDIDQFVEKVSRVVAEGNPEQEYSLEFYRRVSTGDNASQLYTLVADDVESSTRSMLRAYEAGDMKAIRVETHKIRPILKNLSMNSVIMQIDQLSSFEKMEPSVLDIINGVKSKIDPLVKDLRQKGESERKH